MDLFGRYIKNRTFIIAVMAVVVAVLLLTAGTLTSCSGGGKPASNGAEPGGSSSEEISKIASFSTVDLEGNAVTQDVFGDAEITMINFWGTFCPPCIKEMPELQKMQTEYEGRLQVIGVPLDVDFNDSESAAFKNALKYLEWAEADFKNIEAAGDIAAYAQTVVGVPTSIFVDSEGNMIGDPIVGADTEAYKKRIDEYLNE